MTLTKFVETSDTVFIILPFSIFHFFLDTVVKNSPSEAFSHPYNRNDR